jgi:hypothetical protein
MCVTSMNVSQNKFPRFESCVRKSHCDHANHDSVIFDAPLCYKGFWCVSRQFFY